VNRSAFAGSIRYFGFGEIELRETGTNRKYQEQFLQMSLQ
jgi:hypothetical protein